VNHIRLFLLGDEVASLVFGQAGESVNAALSGFYDLGFGYRLRSFLSF
jgi:hypothetical protein